MSSLPSQMYLSQHAPSPTDVLGELLEDARARFARIERSLEEAKESPLDLHNYFEDILEALETQEAQHAEIGEMLVRALLAGHGHEVAALCIEWTALETLRLTMPNDFSDYEGANGAARAQEAPATSAGAETERGTPDSETERSPFRTVAVPGTPQRESDESILSRMAEPVVERERIAEVIPDEKLPPVDLRMVDVSELFAKGQGFDEEPVNHRAEAQKNLEKVQALLRDTVTAPKSFLRIAEAHEPMRLLNRCIEAKNLKRIASLPASWHHAVTDYFTAYARHMQDAICGTFSDVQEFEKEFETIFRTLTNFSEKTRPGYIIGLKKDSSPKDGKTWHQAMQRRRQKLDDLAVERIEASENYRAEAEDKRAERTDILRRLHEEVSSDTCSEEKVVILAREALALHVDPQHPRLLSALRDHQTTLEAYDDLKAIVRELILAKREEQLSAEADNEAKSGLDEPWPFKEYTEGKKLAIIGGNRNHGAEEKIREAFALEEVVWVSTTSGKHARQRKFRSGFKNGSYDFVVAIQNLVGHAWTEMIFKEGPESTVAALSEGYGIKAVGRALERYSDWN